MTKMTGEELLRQYELEINKQFPTTLANELRAKLLSRLGSSAPPLEFETTCAEETVIGQLMESQGLSRNAVLRQALRTYQLVATGHAKLVTEIWGKKDEPGAVGQPEKEE
jgi:hypothetical protein